MRSGAQQRGKGSELEFGGHRHTQAAFRVRDLNDIPQGATADRGKSTLRFEL